MRHRECPRCGGQALACGCGVEFRPDPLAPDDDELGWWIFAEEREVSPEILRVAALSALVDKDPSPAQMLKAG